MGEDKQADGREDVAIRSVGEERVADPATFASGAVAYKKTIVVRYLDNLIAWGDLLFRHDSPESINEATQLYLLAAEILGPCPKMSAQAAPSVEAVHELQTRLDAFCSAHDLIPLTPEGRGNGDAAPSPMLCFSVPQNDKILSFWDVVADRLYKIRHGMNIEGVVRNFALFEPVIDPAVDPRTLVNAVPDEKLLELSKHVSLALIDPLMLLKLRETGRCFVKLPEEFFDLEFPGHYFRRIKAVSITLPCVAGPFTSISCTLRLAKNSIRVTTDPGNGYARSVDDQGLPADDERFVSSNTRVEAIATSSAQHNSDVFELTFSDERYPPFEGAGVISEWLIELLSDVNPDSGRSDRQFDYSSISDVVLHINYTAREGGSDFKNSAVAHLRELNARSGDSRSRMGKRLRCRWPTGLSATGRRSDNG